jgi:hypothetical protein
MHPAETATAPETELTPLFLDHSPDGEPRGQIARVGDVFPLDPSGQRLLASGAAPSQTRPWGLRFARVATPRAGAHEGSTKETTGNNDGTSGGEEISDD